MSQNWWRTAGLRAREEQSSVPVLEEERSRSWREGGSLAFAEADDESELRQCGTEQIIAREGPARWGGRDEELPQTSAFFFSRSLLRLRSLTGISEFPSRRKIAPSINAVSPGR